MDRKTRLCLLAIFGLFAVSGLPPGEPVTPVLPSLYFSSISLAGEDNDPLHDGYNDTVNVSLKLAYDDPFEPADYLITCYLNDSNGRNVITGHASGRIDAGSQTTYIDLNTSSADHIADYTVMAVLSANDTSRKFEDTSSGTIRLYPQGVFRPVLEANDTNPRVLGAGNSTTYIFNLTNGGNCPDTFQLSASSKLGWAVNLSRQSASLGPGECTWLALNVTVPSTPPPNVSDTETVTARPTRDPGTCATMEFTTKVAPFKGDLSIKYHGNITAGPIGRLFNYLFWVANNASSADNVTLRCLPLPANVTLERLPSNVMIPSRATSDDIFFSVMVSGNYSGPLNIDLAVIATSMDKMANATFTATIRLFDTDAEISPDKIQFSNDHPSAGTIINISARISNTGVVPFENIPVRFLNDSNVIATVVIDRLPDGMTKTVACEWTVAPGNSTIKVVIDPDGLIVDMDRSNNVAEIRISIPLPDLTVASSDVKFSGGVPPAGSATTVSVTVHNPGAGDAANVQVELFCDNVSLGIQNISSIDGKGGSGTAKFPWTATKGEHDFTVKVDGDDALPETAESNNVAGRQISVSNGGGGGFIPGFGACILLAAALALVLSRYGPAGRRS